MPTLLFTDLNCPFCYATERRIEALGLSEAVEWRGVEHEPGLPVPMERDDEELTAELAEEVASVRSRAPEVPISLPSGKPNTDRALRAAAAAGRVDPVRGQPFRLALYEAFWRDGRDISDPAFLRELAAEHGLPELEPTREDELQVAGWRLDWERSPLHGVPLLVRSDGETLYGLKETPAIERFLRAAPSQAGTAPGE